MKSFAKKLNKIVLVSVLSAAMSTTAFAADADRVEYVWPHVQEAADNHQMEQNLSSDEYWETVTGAQLRRGVMVYAGENALVRLAPKASYSSGAKIVPAPLDLNAVYSLSLSDDVQLEQLASQKDMEAAGFYDGSVALQLANATGEAVTLATRQNLAADATYLIHVKEKDTKTPLIVNAPRFVQDSQTSLVMDAQINASKPSLFGTRATLIAPDGSEVKARYQNGKVVFAQPLMTAGASQGFYEVELTTLVNVDRQLVKRSIKVPFINLMQTAQMTSVDMGDSASINLSVAEAGRFNITATLQGVDKNGKIVKLQTAEVAEFVEQDSAIALPFQLNEFADYRDLQVVDIKLMDQTRLMPLQFAETL